MNKQEGYEAVWHSLKDRLLTDELFKLDVQNLYYFYENKLLNIARTDKQIDLITKGFEDVVFSQIFQGYAIMKDILSDEELVLDEHAWKMGEAATRNEIPIFMKEIFDKDKVDWSYTQLSHALGMDILNDFESAYEVYENTRVEIAYYGAFKAFLDDPRYQVQPFDSEAVIKLGNPLELEFLSPQVYMTVYAATDENEIWNLHSWSGTQQSTWVGQAHYMQLPMNGSVTNLLNVSVLSIITKDEREMLLNQIIARIPSEDQTGLKAYLYQVEDYEVFFNFNETNPVEIDDVDVVEHSYDASTFEFLK